MPSTYTVNLGIEKPATGEQSGTWGDTTNVNFDIIDQAVNGSERVTLTSAGTSGSPNDLNIVNGSTTSSEGRNKWLEIYSASDLGGSAYVRLVPNDAEKILFIRNSLAGSQSVLLFQGTYNASNDLEIPAGVDMVVKFDGAGASATVTDVFTKLRATEITTPTLTAGTADINGGSVDGATVGAASASTGAFTTLTASTNLNIASSTTVDGVLDEDNMASNSATKLATQQSIKAYVDSQVGTVDTLAEILANGNTSGANNLIIDSGQALTSNTINETTAGSGVTIDSVLLKDDGVNATNLEITNIKANDGTAAATIANSTGNFTITNFISNSVDIGGGAIDGTVIGGSSAAAITGTTITGTSFVSSGDMTFGDSDKAVFGAGSDLQIYHDGSNSYVQDTGDGDLILQGTNVQLRSNNTMRVLQGVQGAETKIFYNNAEKLSTTSTGIDVTGTVTATGTSVFASLDISGDIDVDGTTNLDVVDIDGAVDMASTLAIADTTTIVKTAAGVTKALKLYNNTAGANNRVAIDFHTASTLYGTIEGGYGASSPEMNFIVSSVDNLKLSTSGAVFNEGGIDADFRVESDTNTHALFVDAGNDRLSIDAEVYHDSDSGSQKFYITRTGATDQSGSMYVDDASFVFDSVQDEAGLSNGGFFFRSTNATNTNVSLLELNQAGINVNESGADIDFRVESDTNANAFFLDASNGNIGMGGTSNVPLNIFRDGSGNTELLRLTNDNTNNHNFYVFVNDDDNMVRFGSTGDNGGNFAFLESTNTNDSIVLYTAGGATFNELGNDSDFRVESDSNTHALFVDASENRVHAGGLPSGSVGTAQFIVNSGQIGDSVNDTLRLQQWYYGTGNGSFFGHKARRTDANGVWTGVVVDTVLEVDNSADLYTYITYGISNLVFNEAGNDIDFRVESDGNTLALLVDAGGDFVAIGNNTKTPASNYADQHGFAVDALTGATQISADGLPLELGRTTTGVANGLFIQMRQQSNVVGGIGNYNGVPYIGYGAGTGGGIMFNGLSIEPTALGATRTDGTNDIGSSNYRWGNAYLAGGVYLGGTGADNLLDDYEEGTWTPTIGAITDPTMTYSTQSAVYTKVGNLVSVTCKVITATRSGGSGQLTVDGLPFTVASSVDSPIYIGFNYNWNTPPNGGSCQQGTNHVLLYSSIENNTPNEPVDIVASGNSYLIFSATYRTNS